MGSDSEDIFNNNEYNYSCNGIDNLLRIHIKKH